MKNKIRSLITLAAIAAVAVIGTACSSTNTQQFINSTSGDGVLGKIAVPITQSTSIGASLFVGRFNNSVVLQPTSMNGEVHSPNLALVVAGAGKQAVNGSVGNTNSGSAGISDGSRDASIIVTGSAQAESANGTNMTYKISGQ